MRPTDAVSRRSVLRVTGGAFVGVGATEFATRGLATADPDDVVEVNVGFSASGGRTAALDAANDVVREFGFDALTIRAPKHEVDALTSRSDVRYVEENGRVRALAQTLPWGIDRVDAGVAHANGEVGSGADVAVIDTGIDSDHPELQSNLGKGKAVISCNSLNSSCGSCYYDWDDDNGHGTSIACIIAGDNDDEGTVGVAPGATLHAVKVLDSDSTGSYSDVAAGIEYTANQGWDVANMSFGADSGSQTLEDAVEYAYNNGVYLVAAAGNDGPCTDCVGYPAAYPEVVAVSATDSSDTLSDFSSTGPEIELAAPGENIDTCTCGGSDGYGSASGTSLAAPHVAGGGALVMADGTTNSQARDTLKSTAENIGLADNESGAGLLDVAAALGLSSTDN